MASLMDALVDRRTNNNASLIPFPAPTYAQARCFFGGLVRAIYRLEVAGADRLPVTGPMVIAPNHDSVLDGIVLGAAISRELRFLAKAELWQSRLLGWVLDGLGAIGIKRGTATTSLSLGCGGRWKQDKRSRFSRKAPSTATACGTGVPRAWRL